MFELLNGLLRGAAKQHKGANERGVALNSGELARLSKPTPVSDHLYSSHRDGEMGRSPETAPEKEKLVSDSAR
jgi:hypothetical protein